MVIKTTANEMNRNIEEELGCDGYEGNFTYRGARYTCSCSRKQYALTKRARKVQRGNYGTKVKDLWEEYNCRHTYFGIILGISEPQYEKSELKEFKRGYCYP